MATRAKTSPRMDIASRKQAFVREEIVTSATHLFAERGYRAVTIDDIAANLGYTKSVVYYYFKSKNEILWQLFQRTFDTFSRSAEAIRKENLRHDEALAKMLRMHAINVMKNRETTAIWNRDESELEPQQKKLVRRMKRDYDALFESVFEAGVKEGMFRKMPPHVAVGGMLGMSNWAYVWYDEKGPLTPEEIAIAGLRAEARVLGLRIARVHNDPGVLETSHQRSRLGIVTLPGAHRTAVNRVVCLSRSCTRRRRNVLVKANATAVPA
jgi:TetR/AcrR family transcriptional regulator, cholesterol catabolism regulator